MKYMVAMTKNVFISLFCLWFAAVSSLGAIANAQTNGVDFEAPIIEHEEDLTGVLGNVEVFAATVVDNQELKSVSLFYRYSGDTEFTEIAMQPLFESSYYSATVNTGTYPIENAPDDIAIEYYIRAEDQAGNVVLTGLSFDPYIRSLNIPASSRTITTAPAETPAPGPAAPGLAEQTPEIETAPAKTFNWLYLGLGALIIGSIAAASSGSGDSGGGVVGEPGPGCNQNCTITLTLTRP